MQLLPPWGLYELPPWLTEISEKWLAPNWWKITDDDFAVKVATKEQELWKPMSPEEKTAYRKTIDEAWARVYKALWYTV